MSPYDIRISEDADTDRNKIAAFIAADDPAAAARWIAAIDQKIDGLARFHDWGRRGRNCFPD